jgi:hypothetical protein
MSYTDVNPIAILCVTVFNIVLAMFWYSPNFLGTIWVKEHNFDISLLKPSPWHYVGAIIVSFVTAYVLAFLIYWLNIQTFGEGLKLSFFVWLGFIATTHFSGVIWAQKPFKVYLIDTGYQLISMLVMGSLLSIWR